MNSFRLIEEMLEELRHRNDPKVRIAADAETRRRPLMTARLLAAATRAEMSGW